MFQYDKIVNRLELYIQEAKAHKQSFLSIHSQVQLALFLKKLTINFFTSSYQILNLPLTIDHLTLWYLGQYSQMFHNPTEKHVPIWSIISWLLEYYGLSGWRLCQLIYIIARMIHFLTHSTRRNHNEFSTCDERGAWMDTQPGLDTQPALICKKDIFLKFTFKASHKTLLLDHITPRLHTSILTTLLTCYILVRV